MPVDGVIRTRRAGDFHGVFRSLCIGFGAALLCAACGCRIPAAASGCSVDDVTQGPGLVPGRTISLGGDPAAGGRDAGPCDAWHYLERQVSLGPRNPGSPGHREVREFIESELARYADKVQVHPFDAVCDGATYAMANITALFRSAGGDERPFILLGAHFDTRPRAERDPIPARRLTPILGANDGGSGVAVLLEIAAVLARRRPPVPVMLAFFDGEDYGTSADSMFLGSRRFAGEVHTSDVRCMILLDMVGDADLDIYVEGNSQSSSPGLVDLVWTAAERLGHTDVFHRTVRYHILDDHVPFIERGIPSVDIIDFDYPYWHTTLDTLDKCSPESLRIVRNVIIEAIFSVSSSDTGRLP